MRKSASEGILWTWMSWSMGRSPLASVVFTPTPASNWTPWHAWWNKQWYHLSLVIRKPVFWVSNQVKTQTGLLSYREKLKSWNFEFSNLSSEQKRCWSDCTDAQADLHFYCSHMAKTWRGSFKRICSLILPHSLGISAQLTNAIIILHM